MNARGAGRIVRAHNLGNRGASVSRRALGERLCVRGRRACALRRSRCTQPIYGLENRSFKVQNKLVERLQTLAEALDEAVDHIEMLEAVLNVLEKAHPEAVDKARAAVAAAKKDQRF